MIQEAKSPPTKPPSGKPAQSSATITARSRRGQYSDVRLMKLGMAPPSPRPARKRNASSTAKLGASAVQMVKMPKQAVAPISTALRPDPIRQHAETESAQGEASQRGAEHRAQPGQRNVQIGRNAGRRKPDGLQIEAVEQGDERT